MIRNRTEKRWRHERPRDLIRKLAAIVLWVAAANFFFLPAAHGAQPPGNFEQEWSNLIAAAKQEGTVAIASGGAPSRQYRPVVDVFAKKYGLKVEVSTG
ncbi:MAG TPA: hypothetical protein VK877_15675, partial [Pseudolabrys sp.]|nr:hypothetical protein [Pseudolabrys sp.]